MRARVLGGISVLVAVACENPGPRLTGTCQDVATLPSTEPLRLTRVFPNVDIEGALALRQAPGDSRWYLLTQGGLIYTFPADPTATPTVFADMTDVLAPDSEAGLLGMAFHPDFAGNGFVYLSYTTPGAGAFISRVARYESGDGGLSLDRDTELVILDVTQPYVNHNGGDLHFGPDGYLYFGLGDGGSANDPQGNGQNTDTLLGSMLRLDVDGAEPYAIPPDNPFAGGGGAPEIFAWGLRNPWRWSFDRETGDLWAGDVGQNDWEEVDRIRLGGNYGWNIKEGDVCFMAETCDDTDLQDPVVAYANPGDASVVGGYVYRGGAMPELAGTYLYLDFYLGTVWGVVEGTDPVVLLQAGGRLLSAFAEDADGELYVLDYAGGIFRLEANEAAGNAEPPALLSETHCVDPGDPWEPAAGMLPYEINVPFWSDGATKHRSIFLPDGTNIAVEDDGDWSLPEGAVAVKTFERDGRRVETRLLAHKPGGSWIGYSYAWNADQTDADLLPGRETRTIEGAPWLFPGRADCLACHTSAAGGSLGLETAQLDRDGQLEALVDAGALGDVPLASPLPSVDGDAPLADRARAYLHANCAQCHRPGGRSNTVADFRFATPDMMVCGTAPAAGNLGVPGAALLAPGDPTTSLISLRMHATGTDRMPPLGSLVPDAAGIALVDEWITSLTGCP